MKYLRSEDLDLYVKNYRGYEQEIERLEKKSDKIKSRIESYGGSIVKVSNSKPNTGIKNIRQAQYADILKEIHELSLRRDKVEKFMTWTLGNPDNLVRKFYLIVFYRTLGFDWRTIGDKVGYSYSGARKNYRDAIRMYLKETV